MNRTALALVVAPVAASITYALTIGTAMYATAGMSPPLLLLLIPGLLWGAVFVIAVLLPLRMLVRKMKRPGWLLFCATSLAFWVIVATLLFATRNLSAKEILGNVLAALPCGMAAVAAFALVIHRDSDA